VDEDPCLKHFDRSDWVPDFTKGNYDKSTKSKHQQMDKQQIHIIQKARSAMGLMT
jgi:hypothetical protein